MAERTLAEQIEIEQHQDRRDEDLFSHVTYFLNSLVKDMSLPKIDLSSVTGADEAISILQSRKQLLEEKLTTIRGLRRALQASIHEH